MRIFSTLFTLFLLASISDAYSQNTQTVVDKSKGPKKWSEWHMDTTININGIGTIQVNKARWKYSRIRKKNITQSIIYDYDKCENLVYKYRSIITNTPMKTDVNSKRKSQKKYKSDCDK